MKLQTRDFAAQMIQLWAEAGWRVRCVVLGAASPVCYRTAGLIVERDDSFVVLGDDGCMSMLPAELLSADRIAETTFAGGVTEFHFHFPHCDIVVGDAETGGSDAIH